MVRKEDAKARALYEGHPLEIQHIEQVFLDEMKDSVVFGSDEEARYNYVDYPLKLKDIATKANDSQGVAVDQTMTAKPNAQDPAMTSASSDLGGIDLNPNNVDLKTQSSSEGFEFPFDVNDLKNLPEVHGFTPVIFQITPINNIFQLLGLKDKREEPPKKILPNAA